MRTLITACAVVLALGACSDDPTGPISVQGTYTLTAVDGLPLPKALSIEAGSSTIVRLDAGRLVMGERGGRFTADLDLAVRSQSGAVTVVQDRVEGSYAIAGNTAQFQTGGPSPITGTVTEVEGKTVITVRLNDALGTLRFTESD